MDSAKTPIDKDTMLLLMRFADGELEDGAELARAERLVAGDATCADFVSQLFVLSEFTREAALERAPEGFDVASAVMEKVRAVASATEPAKDQAAQGANVVGIDRARQNRRRAAIVGLLALAAGAILYARFSRQPELAKAAPEPSAVVAPEKQELAVSPPAADPQGGVDVNSVESPQHVSVFVLPESNASASSVVIWIDDPSGGE